MALRREFLTAMGIEADKVQEIINAHVETVDALKAERDRYKEDAEKLPKVQKELDNLKAAAEKDGKDPYKVKYEAIKEDFENYKKEIAAEKAKADKSAAYRALLVEAGISEKRIDAVLKVSDIDSVELDKEGNISGKDKLLKSVKEEWADFIVQETTKGVQTATPPASTGGKSVKSKDEIYAIKDPAERQQAIMDNHELFGI